MFVVKRVSFCSEKALTSQSNSEEELSVKSARFLRDSRHAPLPRQYLTKVASDKQGGSNYDRHVRREVRLLLSSRKKRIIAQRRAQAQYDSAEQTHESDWVDGDGELLPERQPFSGRDVRSVLQKEFSSSKAPSRTVVIHSPDAELQALVSSSSQESAQDKMKRAARKRTVKTRLSGHEKVKAKRRDAPEEKVGSPEAADALRDMTSVFPESTKIDWSSSNITQQQEDGVTPAVGLNNCDLGRAASGATQPPTMSPSQTNETSGVESQNRRSKSNEKPSTSPSKNSRGSSKKIVRPTRGRTCTPTCRKKTASGKKSALPSRTPDSPPKVNLKLAKTMETVETMSEHVLSTNAAGVVSEEYVERRRCNLESVSKLLSVPTRPMSVGATAQELALRLKRGELSRESEEAILNAVASWLSTSDRLDTTAVQNVAAASSKLVAAPICVHTEGRPAPNDEDESTVKAEAKTAESTVAPTKKVTSSKAELSAKSRASQQSCCDSVSQVSLFPAAQESTSPYLNLSATTDVICSTLSSSTPVSAKSLLPGKNVLMAATKEISTLQVGKSEDVVQSVSKYQSNHVATIDTADQDSIEDASSHDATKDALSPDATKDALSPDAAKRVSSHCATKDASSPNALKDVSSHNATNFKDVSGHEQFSFSDAKGTAHKIINSPDTVTKKKTPTKNQKQLAQKREEVKKTEEPATQLEAQKKQTIIAEIVESAPGVPPAPLRQEVKAQEPQQQQYKPQQQRQPMKVNPTTKVSQRSTSCVSQRANAQASPTGQLHAKPDQSPLQLVSKTPTQQTTAHKKKKSHLKPTQAPAFSASETTQRFHPQESAEKPEQSAQEVVQVTSETVETVSISPSEAVTQLPSIETTTTQSDTTTRQEPTSTEKQARSSPSQKSRAKISKRQSIVDKQAFIEAFHAQHFPNIPTSMVNDRWTRDWQSSPQELRREKNEATRSHTGVKSRARSSVVGRKTRLEKEGASHKDDGFRTRAAHSLDVDPQRLKLNSLSSPQSRQKMSHRNDESVKLRRTKETSAPKSQPEARHRNNVEVSQSDSQHGENNLNTKHTKKKKMPCKQRQDVVVAAVTKVKDNLSDSSTTKHNMPEVYYDMVLIEEIDTTVTFSMSVKDSSREMENISRNSGILTYIPVDQVQVDFFLIMLSACTKNNNASRDQLTLFCVVRLFQTLLTRHNLVLIWVFLCLQDSIK